ncbi:nickel pincer cofactor biosynthesis protein LarB [Sphaerimonospora mesophila]|uniref:nickel pincer cofactor biosynthesis protein LarB n=1 Tax=Sphaerimonospora mesophila TaxID=37483 RepID=UPI0006E40CE2
MTGAFDLGYARIDLERETRQGLPEIVYGPGKRASEIVGIVTVLLGRNTGPVLVTRVEPDAATAVLGRVAGGRYDRDARLLVWREARRIEHTVAVVTAGTADGPVAAEAAAVACALGLRTTLIRDVGVAGLHRVLAAVDDLRAAHSVIVIAGMEGALASVIGGLVETPVIAVPTSTGYGAALEGVTALLAMLTSCAAGITVVNIDSGFGAALAAFRLTRGAT